MHLDRLKDIKLQGFPKFLHTLFLVMTYPLRHFGRFLLYVILIVLALALIPLLLGVQYDNIWDWYFLDLAENKTVETTQKQDLTPEPNLEVNTTAEQPTKTDEPVVKSVEEKVIAPQVEKKTNEAEVVSATAKKYAVWHIKKTPETEILPKSVEKIPEVILEEKPVEKVEPVIEEKIESAPVEDEIQAKPEEEQTSAGLEQYYRKVDGLGLKYLEKPYLTSGQAVVYGPNDIYINETYVYLYGIYTDSYNFDVNRAEQYLRDLIAGKRITCQIIAMTKNDVATGVCFLDGWSINQHLVDAGMAANVAL